MADKINPRINKLSLPYLSKRTPVGNLAKAEKIILRKKNKPNIEREAPKLKT